MKKLGEKMVLVMSLSMIIWALWMGIPLIREYRQAQDSYEEAAETYVIEREFVPEKKPRLESGKKKKQKKRKAPIQVDFAALQEKNRDVIGWIYIPSIDLSYPILQGTDNEYYLTHTWDKQEIFAASIFMDYRNYPDFEDYNTIIYGHNMKDGTMFHNIQYCMEPEHYQNDPYIWILTPQENYRYLIFTEYDTRYDSDTYTIFDGPGKSLATYLTKMQRQSLWQVDVPLKETEHVLTLSTCNGEHDLRRIVQGVRR